MHISDRALVRSEAGAALTATGAQVKSNPDLVLLCRGVVSQTGTSLSADELAERLASGTGLAELGAPFAAMSVTAGEAVAAADHVGLRHLYATRQNGWAAIGTSARELASLTGAPLDHDALSVQRMIGHHLDSDTAYQGVRKLPPGHLWRLRDGELAESAYPPVAEPDGEDPAASHALRLRDLVAGFLDTQPDAVLELSGGLDSRMVLAAVPPERRQGLRAFTIVAAGSSDGPVATRLAERYGLQHTTVSLDGLSELAPEAAYELAYAAALHQDGLGAPLSAAAFGWAEAQVDPAPRLSGHGGELARGAYYLQRPHPNVQPELIDRLAHWWIFANYAVDDAALEHDFALESRKIALRRVRAAFGSTDSDWITATDDFFLRQRLHRWAGITITDGCSTRLTFNPLLDPQVLALARMVPSRLRTGSRYAAGVLDLLDPELARLPLGSGLRPVALSRQLSLSRRLGENTVRGFVGKVGSKVMRRLLTQRRAAVGAEALAELVVQHWRAEPHLLDPVVKTGLVNEDWLAQLVDGAVDTDATTADFLLNLAVAAGAHQRA